jgi:hypothetical protein
MTTDAVTETPRLPEYRVPAEDVISRYATSTTGLCTY